MDRQHHHESDHLCIDLVPIFNHLNRDALVEIMNRTNHRHFDKNEIVFQPGDRFDVLYMINKGKVRLYTITESGNEQLIGILNPGDYLGELALFTQRDHDYYAQAIMDTEICMMSQSDLFEYLKDYPSVSIKIMSRLADELQESHKSKSDVVHESVMHRLADYLLDLSRDQASDVVTLPMSKKDIALYLSTTPETISRRLKSLEDKNIVESLSSRTIKILDEDELEWAE